MALIDGNARALPLRRILEIVSIVTEIGRWLPVVGFEGFYEVSDQGSVRSLDRVTIDTLGRPHPITGRIMKTPPNHDGYPIVPLRANSKHHTRLVHCLVAYAFLGPRPEGMEVCHGNDIPDDNRLENLRYGTRQDNVDDLMRNKGHFAAAQEVCKWGHVFDGHNGKQRTCSECSRRRVREWRERQRGKVIAA